MQTTLSALHAELADREAIRHCLMRYCRGIDRMDEEMVLGVYWPDAVDEHLVFSGSPREFVDWCMPLMRGMEQTSHLLGCADRHRGRQRTSSCFSGLSPRARRCQQPRGLFLGGRYLHRRAPRRRMAHREGR
jgi:hypothetical protein